jgi:RHS repeat protein
MIQCDRLASVTDPLNQVTTYAYDHGQSRHTPRVYRNATFCLVSKHFLSCGCVKAAPELKWLPQIDAQAICFPIAPQRELQAF